MFYETNHSLGRNLMKVENGADFNFPAHLHSSFELVLVTEGQMLITVDKKQYAMEPGNALLIFPNQVHSMETPEHSRHFLCIFSTQVVHAYSDVFQKQKPESNLFTPDPFYLKELLDLNGETNKLKVKGLLYGICGAFDQQAVYQSRPREVEDLLLRIFGFVENNYRKVCTLEALSAYTTYHEAYLSRYFRQRTGLTFTEHVNNYRVSEAMYLLQDPGKRILEVAFECGFDSLRSFNRNFKKVLGVTPQEYRQKGLTADKLTVEFDTNS